MPRDYDDYPASPNPKRFYRARQDKILGGVCGGLAERFGWEPTLVRIGAILLALFGGPAVLGYFIAWVIVPKEPMGRPSLSAEEDAFWRGVSDRPTATFGNLKYTFMDLEDRLKNLERSVTSDEWRLRKEFRDLEGH